MPQKYYTVKALALLCMWPIPSTAEMGNKKGTEKPGPGLSRLGLSELDPTFMLSGIMMQIAMQTGLYISSQLHELTQQYRNSGKPDIEDRQLTWAVCNIVSQGYSRVQPLHLKSLSDSIFSVAITYGRPSRLMYDSDLDWSLAPLGTDIDYRLKIMRFCDKMTSNLYRSLGGHSEALEDHVYSMWGELNGDLSELESFAAHVSRELYDYYILSTI